MFCRELYLVLRWIISKLEWLLGESAVDRLVGCDSGGGAFESDGGQDGEVFRHMLCNEGMGCGRGCLGGESTGWAAGFATREYWEVCWEEPYAGDTALDCFASAMKDDGFAGFDPFINLVGR
jgi:hypothetical protein